MKKTIPYEKYYKLRTCPFCKGPARLVRSRPMDIKGEQKHVSYCKCTECFTRSGFMVLEEFERKEDAWDLAAQRWNERKTELRMTWIPARYPPAVQAVSFEADGETVTCLISDPVIGKDEEGELHFVRYSADKPVGFYEETGSEPHIVEWMPAPV